METRAEGVSGIDYNITTVDGGDRNTTVMEVISGTDIADRRANLSISGSGREERSMALLKIVSAIVSSATLLMVVFVGILLHRFKNKKIIRASSPALLLVTLLGAVFQYLSFIVQLSSVHKPVVACIVSQWFHLIGFTLMYGALGLKTWRVSVILLFYKSRQLYTKDKALVVRLLGLLSAAVFYLAIWTFLSLHSSHDNSELQSAVICSVTNWTHVIAYLGELLLLIWGCVMCYQARLAPTLYNDATCQGMAMANQIIWMLNFLLSRYYLRRYHSNYWSLLTTFIYVQFTVTFSILLVFIPKFSCILSKTRTVEGTVTDVYGPSRVHRLTLVINKTGSVKNISCSPCGPLEHLEDSTEHTETSDVRETRETEYSKEEVNALIDLVSKFKSERQYYKTQLKTLITDLRRLKSQSGDHSLSWPTTPHVPPTPCTNPSSVDHQPNTLQLHSGGYSPKSYWLSSVLAGQDGLNEREIVQQSLGINVASKDDETLFSYCNNSWCCDEPYERKSQKRQLLSGNGLERSRTTDSLSTILTTVSSLSPNMDVAETRLGTPGNSWGNPNVITLDRATTPDVSKNSSANASCGEKISWLNSSCDVRGCGDNVDNGSGLIPLSFDDQGSKVNCVTGTDRLLNYSQKSLSKNRAVAPVSVVQRPNTLTISNHNASSQCYTKKTHYVFYI